MKFTSNSFNLQKPTNQHPSNLPFPNRAPANSIPPTSHSHGPKDAALGQHHASNGVFSDCISLIFRGRGIKVYSIQNYYPPTKKNGKESSRKMAPKKKKPWRIFLSRLYFLTLSSSYKKLRHRDSWSRNWTQLNPFNQPIWVFPKIMVPPNHPF